jgi:uncharacterized phage protein (TIGR02218 family)
MKTLTSAIKLHLTGNLTTLCTCWRIARLDGVLQCFTSAADDLTYKGEVYKSVNGAQPSAAESTATLAVANLEIEGLLNSGSIEAVDLATGRYDGAGVKVFMLNRNKVDDGELSITNGSLGEVTWQQGKFTAEVRGLAQTFSQAIIELTSKTCRASLGDERCQANMGGRRYEGTIVSNTDRRVFVASGLPTADGLFNYGVLEFLTGACASFSMEVRRYSEGGKFELMLPMPFNLAPGDTFRVEEGCDRTIEVCIKQFSNAINFQGEPYVPEPSEIAAPPRDEEESGGGKGGK